MSDIPKIGCVNHDCDRCKAADELRRLEAEAEVQALRSELQKNDRMLRASVSDQWKGCTSPVGAVQAYIAELEAELQALRGAVPSGWKLMAAIRAKVSQ